jgi:hypothetical protein
MLQITLHLLGRAACGHFNSKDLKCFKSGYKKKHFNRFYRQTQSRDFRPLEDKPIVLLYFIHINCTL